MLVLILAAMMLWLAAALVACRMAPAPALAVRVVLAALGVPLLGYATLTQGPLPGLAGLGLGTAVLMLHRLPFSAAVAEAD